MTITSFDGPFRWLSNFALVRIVFDGVQYPTVEHAYQAAKTVDPAQRANILACVYPDGSPHPGKSQACPAGS